ncbi:radical SAM family heme chaperone HemW [Virgibacillus necropolis]|uniref:Heme chaperone HemW n=1 Tax=Virgibacillus necropolis TaxID=163877 RepID=A0A221MC41_9BACI|nr:radical SAM family heme chaperone HemW [Virgibacillus necropolis]ASN05180.1 coproporphyrinogen III oxidase [Virgibacillus necropolis]
MIQSVYIHIPFCQQICHYCDFTKFFYNEKLADEYMEALANEIRTNVDGMKTSVKTIFIGGGTPTALNLNQLELLFQVIDERFDVDGCLEYTIEANPGDFDEDKAKLLKSYGVNRVSLGVQAFDNQLLEDIGRLHKIKDVYDTVNLLKKHGIHNISIDLIYALPNQTVEGFEKSLQEAIKFDLPHYSTYSLQIEPKTVFYQRHKKGKLHRPPQEDEVRMYHILRDTMKKNGIQQYEISNFAKPGYESKHNLTYWNNDYYYGFGAGAHGYLPGKRTGNIRPLPAYVKQAMKDGHPILSTEEIGLKEMVEEEMFLGLRKREGVSKLKFEQKFSVSVKELYGDAIKQLVEKGWLYDRADEISLTPEGILFGNNVFAQFLLEDENVSHLR